uniref:NADH-ubiquinone oxidoreductase chain 3 n=1 Tax=Bothromesostoma personatum TaxID=27905 RepID=A0A343VVJ0_9PLAT
MFILLGSAFSLFFLFLILGIGWVYWNKGKNFFNNREKSSPFECGFDPNNNSRLPFSLRFFLLLVFFLIFDIEVILLIELPVVLNIFSFNIIFVVNFFLIIVFLGLIEEWRRGILNWKT